jgi:UDP-glucose 4-epimerase
MPPAAGRPGVTGPAVVIGSGFIGRAAAAAVAATGRPTVILTRKALRVSPLGTEAIVCDLSDTVRLRATIRPGSDVLFAAGSSVPADDENEPRQSINALAPLIDVMEVMRDTPGASLLFVSSGGAVYGEPDTLPVGEGHPLRPRSAYGAAKAAAETFVSYFARRYGLHATSLRCGNAYGPGQVPGRGQGLIGELLAAAEAGRRIDVWGDGSVRRDYVYVGDIADTVVALCGRRDLPEAINIGSGHATSVLEVIAMVSEVMGHRVDVRHLPRRPFDVERIALDITRLRGLIDFDPVSVQDGVGLTWESMVADTVA